MTKSISNFFKTSIGMKAPWIPPLLSEIGIFINIATNRSCEMKNASFPDQLK